jgi:chromate transporter
MAKTAKITWKTVFIPIGAALFIWGLGVSPVWIILAVIVGSIVYGVFVPKVK